MTVALVTGATGQDGSYLVERLLSEGVEVHGLVRREDLGGTLPEGLVVHELDLDTDPAVLGDLVARVGPDELYNLGGVSSVARSWQDPLLTTRVNGEKVVRMWADAPPYVLVVPGLPADVPPRGVTVTSWQRALICKSWNARTLAAIRAYRDTYRGAGPEQIPSLNSGATAEDLPIPVLPDPTG